MTRRANTFRKANLHLPIFSNKKMLQLAGVLWVLWGGIFQVWEEERAREGSSSGFASGNSSRSDVLSNSPDLESRAHFLPIVLSAAAPSNQPFSQVPQPTCYWHSWQLGNLTINLSALESSNYSPVGFTLFQLMNKLQPIKLMKGLFWLEVQLVEKIFSSFFPQLYVSWYIFVENTLIN